VVANIAYQAGTYLFAFVGSATLSVILSITWGLVILGVLILRIRNVLHLGLMEAALERSARTAGIGAEGELEFCAQCELPLLEHAAFCNACGTAVRVQAKAHRVNVGAQAASAQSIVPGFDTPVAGEEDTSTRVDTTTAAETTTATETGEVPPEQSTEEMPRRSRFYDDEEGRA
jgi:uncharacterized Zn finger protein (UPF0148 family)